MQAFEQRPVVVKRSGFLTATAYGLFGFLTVVVLCAAGLGFFILRMADGKADWVLDLTRSSINGLAEWQGDLPPVLSDALSDRRDPAYTEQLDVQAELVQAIGRRSYRRVAVDVHNRGTETVTLLAIRVVLTDRQGAPVRTVSTYAATPLTVENEWRGPILPGSTRQCTIPAWTSQDDLKPVVEITDVRVWRPKAVQAVAQTATVAQVAH